MLSLEPSRAFAPTDLEVDQCLFSFDVLALSLANCSLRVWKMGQGEGGVRDGLVTLKITQVISGT